MVQEVPDGGRKPRVTDEEIADVSDWDVIAEAIRARGRGHGDVLHLPEFDLEEIPETDARPDR